ncbi:MAG TPA: hypothetical protein VGQ68_06825 [Gaiellaceae bacterium]|nr:hypothetical protein [Gaiellaceae bacterium]
MAAAVVTACGAAKPSASDDRAGLAFTRYVSAEEQEPSVWVADADGSNARQLAAEGRTGELSPDGRRVTYYVARKPVTNSDFSSLYVQDVEGGKPRLIGEAAWSLWSPDSSLLVVDARKVLFLVDVESGKRRELARDIGWGRSGSFAPDGEALAFTRGNGKVLPEYRSDIFVLSLADGKIQQLTDDGHSDAPVWGAKWIAYRHFRFEGDAWPQLGEIRLIRPDGSGDRLFARGDESLSRAHYGLEPLDFSTDGKRLLACNSHEFSCGPVTFTVPDGKRHEISVDDEPEMIPFGSDLARDGSEVLVEVGPFDSPGERVYAVPFEGGAARLLVKQADDASWAR